MKTLILGVSCADEFCDDHPQTCIARLDEDAIARIRKLANAARELDVYSLSEFHYLPTWHDGLLDLEPQTSPDEPQTKTIIAEMAPSETAVEIPMICVTKDGFRFEAVPKHGSARLAISTSTVPLQELARTEVYISEQGADL